MYDIAERCNEKKDYKSLRNGSTTIYFYYYYFLARTVGDTRLCYKPCTNVMDGEVDFRYCNLVISMYSIHKPRNITVCRHADLVVDFAPLHFGMGGAGAAR